MWVEMGGGGEGGLYKELDGSIEEERRGGGRGRRRLGEEDVWSIIILLL